MADERELADHPANVSLSSPEPVAKGYRPYQRYRLTLRGAAVTQTRDLLRAGKVVAVLPVDLARDEIVLIRQFRLAAHLATGKGEMIEIVAGRVEAGEQPLDAARRECGEEIGVVPGKLVELFSYMTTPGITDEDVTVFLGAIDASQVPRHVTNPTEGEQIETLRVPIDTAIAALRDGHMRNGPLVIALQWLALNRARVSEFLAPR